MSKSDASGAQSLEEILAQIKKSVAGEPGTARTDAAEGAGEESGDRTADAGLSARLAGVLKETGAGTPGDENYSQLLATEEKAPNRDAPPDPAKPTDRRSQTPDPLWFLRQPSGAAPESGSSAATERTQPGAALIVEEIKLSRPQDLRSSLPPLFGSDNEQASVARMPAADVPKAPPSPPPQVAVPDELANSAPDNMLTANTQPALPPAATTDGAGLSEPEAELTVQPMSAAATIIAQPVSATPPSSETDFAGQPQGAPTAPSATIEQRPAVESTPADAGPQARSLEQVIGELLEPVIRQWLEANLPRLAEEVVRKEVARAIAERPKSVV